MTEVIENAYLAAIKSMVDAAPMGLHAFAQFTGKQLDASADVSLPALCMRLTSASINDALRGQIHLAVAKWDAEESAAPWTKATLPHTRERRASVYDALDLDDASRTTFDSLFPLTGPGAVVISDTFEPWYDDDRRKQHVFYWDAYSRYLLNVRKWNPESLAKLDAAASRVIERVSDPTRAEEYPSRGLVVGYVQSGKTANFTGVLAKGIDAGYRLLIVLTGTIDILRQQTQRRIDMELVGVENILRGADPDDPDMSGQIDYQDDPDWFENKYLRHGFLPSEKGFPDVVRLTTHKTDYRRLRAGITALELEKRDKTKPLFDSENLFYSGARLAVIKKNTTVLRKLVKDLKTISSHLAEIPTLIIDDESDQATVNTSNPKKWAAGQTERTATNKLIGQLLKLLPRAQYVGYTATPYANVFIDPSDSEDVFPKDFLVSLDRPDGYMGVRDFHDLDLMVDEHERNVANSQEKAFVRNLVGDTDEERKAELRTALDAFVLAGAMKLYREETEQASLFRHHTMLAHQSVRVADQAALAEEIRSIWKTAGYASGSAMKRLEDLFVTDYLPVSAARSDGQSYPVDFLSLRPYVAQAVSRIVELHGDPVIIVNGDKDLATEALDFDKRPVWRVLVGGAKLSRGFTIEGLTISYFRRRTKQADTLMQMGRWFGFRRGYQDLVRLYIGRREPDGNSTIDLYEAFGAIVRDEEAFREQLRQYATPVDGEPQITPAQIPPLVSQHLPMLKPTAANKMYNARLVVLRSPGTPVEPVGYPKQSALLADNYAALFPALQEATQDETFVIPSAGGGTSFKALIGLATHSVVLKALAELKWVTDDYFAPNLAYLEEISDEVDDWLVLLPQVQGYRRDLPGLGSRSLFSRKRRRDPLFGAISDPKHRFPTRRIAGSIESYGDPAVEKWCTGRRGALLVYPVVENPLTPATSADELAPGSFVPALVVTAPAAASGRSRQLVQFVARNKALEREAIVDVS
jgi:hypothetical protein